MTTEEVTTTRDDPSEDGALPRLGPGTLVDHFRVTRLIGHGAMGQVYLGRDEQLGRRVALKVIHPRHLRAEHARTRFLREARTTAQFSHPHIVTIYAVGEHQGQPYLAMEYLEGQNLRQRMAEGGLAAVDPVRLGLAVAEALAEAHRHGVVHRDLKPENVVIPLDGRPRVLDFGLARDRGPERGGDPGATPPERGGDPEATPPRPSPEAGEGDRVGKGFHDEVPPLRGEGSGGVVPEPSPWSGARDQATIHAAVPAGTPAYMAPEQWRRGESGTASDVWALGVMLHELVTGRRPFSSQEVSIESLALRVSDGAPVAETEQLAGLRPQLRELVLACLDKDPGRRPTADEVAARLRLLLVPGVQPPCREGGEDCPFPGLQPFTEGLAQFFFGREREIDAFLELVRAEPILPVVGPSGAGKSSFVRAGVIPRLRERADWIVIDLKPGNAPYLALGAALAAGAGTAPTHSTTSGDGGETDGGPRWDAEGRGPSDHAGAAGRLAEQLFESPGLLGLQLRRLAERAGAQVLLFVDQLEELHTLAGDERTRRRFMDMLCTAADDPRDPVRLVITLRDDFLGLLAEGERARQALSRVTVLRSPGPAALEETLVKPLGAVGYRFEPTGLARRMVEAVAGEAASLPLIQFTARLLWEQRDVERRLLTEARYEALGGVEGAIAEHADGVLAGMTPGQVGLARELLLRLITPAGTRRVVAREAILAGLGPEGGEVLRRLTQARLVSVRRALAGDDEGAELELAHESLIRGWERLSRWFDEGREDLAFLAQASQAAELWDTRGRREEEVWQGEALRDAWRNARRLREVPPQIAAFLQAGERREHRRLRRRRGLLAGAVTALALAAVGSAAGALALAEKEDEAQRQRRRAEGERQRAEEQGAEALREGARAAFLRGDLVQARAMLRASLEERVSPLGQALWWRLATDPLLWRRELGGDVDAVAFSPDGSRVAAVCDAPSVFVFDVRDMELRTLRGHHQKPDDVAFSPDGRLLASTSSDGTLRLWDLERDSSDPTVERDDGGGPLAFSPRGDLLAAGHRDGLVRVWPVESIGRAAPRVLRHGAGASPSPIAAVAFDPTGALIAATSMDGRTALWDAATGTLAAELPGEGAPVLAVAFHPTGRLVATGSSDSTVTLWRIAGPGGTAPTPASARETVLRHPDAVRDLAFSPDGALLAAGTAAGRVHLWDVETRREAGQIAHGEGGGEVLTLAFSPQAGGELLATGGTDQTLRVWQRGPALAAEPDRGHTAAVLGAAFSPDGRTVATGSNDQTVRLWDVESGDQRAVLQGRTPARATGVVFGPDGRLATAGADGRIRLWDAETGRQERVLAGPPWYITALAYHPGGRLLASASFDGAVRLWDVEGADAPTTVVQHDAWATDVAFSPDGRLLASGGQDRTVRLWDVEASRPWRGTQGAPSSPGEVYGLAFSPDGVTLAFTAGEEPVQLWSLASGARSTIGPSGSNAYWISFHPDGGRLGLPLADHTARVVDRETGETVVLRGHHGEVNYVRFSPDGRLAVTTSDDGTVRLWDAETGRPIWWAPALLDSAPQVWSQRGWASLAPGDPAATRPRWHQAVETRARLALEAPGGGTGCLATFDDQLELWRLAPDERAASERVEGIDDVVALDEGCLVLARGEARLHRLDAEPIRLADQAVAVAPGRPGQVLVARGRQVLAFGIDAGEEAGQPLEAGLGIEVMLALDDAVVVGFGDGGLEVFPVGGEPGRPAFTFEGLPASAPVALAAGPQRTLVAGFMNGVVGLWSLENGSLISRFRLHGPARHVRVVGAALHVVTELGDRRSLDLDVLGLDECALLRHLWARVPVTWLEGTPQRRPPPNDHRCAPRP